MPKAEIRFSNTPGRIPTIEELEGFKFGWNTYDAILYGVEEIAGVKTVVPIGGGGGGSDHPRAHQIDSIEDHPPVPEGKRGKIVATHPVTGAIVLIDPVTGDLTHYCYIAWRDAPGDGFTMIPNMSLQYEAILFTHEEITSPVEADFDGCWRERVIDKQALPPGGITDQALVKKTDDDYDVEWKTVGGGDSYEYWRLKGSSVVEVKFGLLYNWYAATDARKITSSDTWRVTESADWKALLLALGGIDQGSTVWSELPDEFGQFPLNNHYPLCDSDSQYWDTFVGTNTLNFNFRGSGRRLVIYDEETETINTYFDNKGIYGYSLCSDTSSGNELFIFMWERYSILFFSTYATSPTAKKTGYPIKLVRPATAEELLLSDGTACDPYTGNDGKSYRTVKLLDLVWIADNLAETKFRNGDYIPGFDGGVYTPITNEAWAALTTSALCAYNDNLDNAFIPFISSEIHVNSHDLVSFKDSATVEFSVTENEDGEKEITAEAIGGGNDHPRAHQIDSIEDHPPVPEGKRGKIVATDLTTGEIELIDKSQIALDVYSEDDGFYPVETIYKKFPESNAERITTIQKPQGLMYGGKVSWLDGMLFAVSGAIYFIRGELYKADDLIITLQASNPDNPRIDVIVATEDNEFSVITGTPAANALKPYINPITQVEIAEILIPAGATGFGGLIFRNVIYNENTEWTGTGVGVVVDFDSTTDPYFGLKCADVGNIQTADYVKFESAGNVSIVDFDLLHLALKFKFNVTTLSALLVEFYLDGVLVSSPRNVPFLSGPDKWQHISIEMSSISFSDAFYNEIRFVWFYPIAGGVAYQPGFYLDYIRLEKGISPPPTPRTIYLAGDVSGSGSVGHPIRTTLRTVNSNVGTFGSTIKIPKVTVNKKGLVTAVEEVDAEGGGTDSAFVYIAYASDASGTGFTLTFNATLDYIAILSTDTEIPTPVVGDFTGLWKKYKGEDGVGVPTGGTTGQVLKKQSATDYDTAWDDESGGSGGSTELTSVPATNQTASGITTTFTANEAQSFGDVVRINSAGKAQLAKADVIANATALAMCISESVEADATGNYLLIGFVRNDAWDWIPGGEIYLSLTGTTGNTLTQVSPFTADPIVEDTVVQMVGVANTADTFYFNPQLVQVELKPN